MPRHVTAEPLEFALLQNAQQLHLNIRRHVALPSLGRRLHRIRLRLRNIQLRFQNHRVTGPHKCLGRLRVRPGIGHANLRIALRLGYRDLISLAGSQRLLLRNQNVVLRDKLLIDRLLNLRIVILESLGAAEVFDGDSLLRKQRFGLGKAHVKNLRLLLHAIRERQIAKLARQHHLHEAAHVLIDHVVQLFAKVIVKERRRIFFLDRNRDRRAG